MSEIKCTCGRRTPFAHMHAFDCPVFSPQEPPLTKAEELLHKLFNANEQCIKDGCTDEPVVSQWPGSPMREEIAKFLGIIPTDPVEDQLQRDEMLFGNSFALLNEDGTKTRLDPAKVVMRKRGDK